MSDVFTNRSGQGRGKAGGDESSPQPPPRIRIDVPLGTSYYEMQESIFRQAWQLAGSQFRAAVALGITPDTISRFLRRCDRARVASPKVPEAWPLARPPEPPPDSNRGIGPSDQRVIDGIDRPTSHAAPGEQVIGRKSGPSDRVISDDRATGKSGERMDQPNAPWGRRAMDRKHAPSAPPSPVSRDDEAGSFSDPEEDAEQKE